jgi:apolipoprotein N-acyltransferase
MAKSATRKWLVISGSVLAVWIAISLIILSGRNASPKLKVAALQPNYGKPAFQDKSTTDTSRVEDLTKWAFDAAGIGAQIVFTPEMMFNFDPQEKYTSELQAFAKEKSIYMFLDYTFAVEGHPWRNEAVLLGPDGNFYSPAYAKNHAPPGEPLSPTAGEFPVYGTPLGRLAAMICHDANYTDVARKLTANGAQLISAGLNEFGGFGEQFWTNATFRAVENQVAVVVTSRQTGSAIIDAHGRQKALDLTPNKQVVLTGEVNIGSGPTIYTRLGDILGWISLAGMIFFIVFQAIIQGKAKKERKA